MRKNWLFRTAVITAAVLMLMTGTGTAETAFPPSPEPPAANMTGRPTPVPTEVPGEIIIDHVHHPEYYPKFSFLKDRKLLEIWFPNIKDADEAILIYDGQVWMIDCGTKGAALRGELLLRQLGIKEIDMLLNTHPHHDHIEGLAITDDAAKVKQIKICFAPDLTLSGLVMIRTAEERGIPVTEYRDGQIFSMGDGAVKLLVLKNNEEYLDMNNQSAVMRITYGKRIMLFTADMEAPGQEAMINRIGTDILKCDIVKYPHHAKSDLYTPFYEAMGAGLTIVTSVEGRGDRGQIAINSRKLPAVYTSVKGKFTHLVTDGEYWLVEQVDITVK